MLFTNIGNDDPFDKSKSSGPAAEKIAALAKGDDKLTRKAEEQAEKVNLI